MPDALVHNDVMLSTRFALSLLLLLAIPPAFGLEASDIMDVATRHIQIQIQGIAGESKITVSKPETSRLPPCSALEAFSPPGARMIGKTNIGVRCLSPNAWTILVPAYIAIQGSYTVTARALLAGQTIQPGDLHMQKGDLSLMPTGLVADPEKAIGKTLRNALGAGQPLREDQILSPLLIRQGQNIRVISTGSGFSVSSEGKAMNNASEGQLVQVRMASGQTVSGKAKNDGSVEIHF